MKKAVHSHFVLILAAALSLAAGWLAGTLHPPARSKEHSHRPGSSRHRAALCFLPSRLPPPVLRLYPRCPSEHRLHLRRGRPPGRSRLLGHVGARGPSRRPPPQHARGRHPSRRDHPRRPRVRPHGRAPRRARPLRPRVRPGRRDIGHRRPPGLARKHGCPLDRDLGRRPLHGPPVDGRREPLFRGPFPARAPRRHPAGRVRRPVARLRGRSAPRPVRPKVRPHGHVLKGRPPGPHRPRPRRAGVLAGFVRAHSPSNPGTAWGDTYLKYMSPSLPYPPPARPAPSPGGPLS